MKNRKILFTLLFVFILFLSGCVKEKANQPSNKPPSCSLDASPSRGYAPLVVSFLLNASDSDGYITSWQLDVDGDGVADYKGNGSELPKRIYHPYIDAGDYYPKLTVVDNDGLISNQSIHIHICKKPFFKVEPTEGYAPLKVTFYANLSSFENISHWSIDFNGDAIPDYSGKNLSIRLSYTYKKAGAHEINFVVSGNCGAITQSVGIYVKNKEGNVPPYCTLEADPSYGVAPLTVNFTIKGFDVDGYIVSWKLDVDNDGIAEFNGSGGSESQQYTYQNAGTYIANLTVIDNKGAYGYCNCKIVVNEGEWHPEYGVKYQVHVTNVIDGDTFDATFPNGSIERVRLLGVDCPEKSASNNKPNEYDSITNLTCLAYWGTQAKYFAENWLEDKDVYIEFDSTAGFKGYYGRWLCYVYTQNNTDFNAVLVRKGLARVYTEGECSKESYYLTLQQQAMNSKIGLWSCMQEQGGGGVVILTVHYDAAGNDWQNLNDEYVVIKNEGNESVDMTGWTLSDEANHVFTFPSFVLNAGATVTVYTGSGNNTQDKLYWGSSSPIWNNDHDTAYLKDGDGNLVDSWEW